MPENGRWDLIRRLKVSRIQSRLVTGLLTGNNALRRHRCIMGLIDSPLCRRCGAADETSDYVLCECEALATLRRPHLGSFFLDPDDVMSLSLGAFWNIMKGTGLL